MNEGTTLAGAWNVVKAVWCCDAFVCWVGVVAWGPSLEGVKSVLEALDVMPSVDALVTPLNNAPKGTRRQS